MVKAKKIKENRWRASIYIGKNEYGKNVYKDIYGTTEKECNTKVIDFIYKKENNLLENNLLEKTKLKTVEDFYDEWLENRLDIKETTRKEYISIKKCHLTPLLKVPIKTLTNTLLKKYYKELFAKTNANTTRRVSRLFNCFIRDMIYDKRVKLDRDILDNLSLPKTSNYKPYFVNKDEYKNILDILKKEYLNDSDIGYLYILLIICGGCGLRISEALAIHIKDIDISKGTIKINKQETQCKGKGYYILESSKTDSGDRVVVMPKVIKDIVIKHINFLNYKLKQLKKLSIELNNTFLYIDKDNKEYRKSGSELLISSKSFKLIPKNTAHRNWKIFRESLGYDEKIRIHDMRRLQATILRDNHVPEDVAKLQMGHSDAVMTRYYQNTDIDTLIDYISNIDIKI